MHERSPEQRRGGGEGGWKQPRNQIRDDGMGQVEVPAAAGVGLAERPRGAVG